MKNFLKKRRFDQWKFSKIWNLKVIRFKLDVHEILYFLYFKDKFLFYIQVLSVLCLFICQHKKKFLNFIFMLLWKRGHIVLQLLVSFWLVCPLVGWSAGLSVCRPSVVRSISFDLFTWSIPNLVQWLPSMSRWSLLIFRSHVQR